MHVNMYFRVEIKNINMSKSAIKETRQEILNMISSIKDESELLAIKQLISNYYASKAEKALEQLWDNEAWTEKTLENFENAHYRTPYTK